MRRVLTSISAGIVLLLLLGVPFGLYELFVYYRSIEHEVVTKLAGHRWNLPSRIYSDALLVYRGQNLSDLGFFERLSRLNYHRVERNESVRARGEYRYDPDSGSLELFLHAFDYPYRHFPGRLIKLKLSPNQRVLAIVDGGSGEKLYSFKLEPELLSGIYQGTWEQRRIVRLSAVPPLLVDAILAAEDHRFYEHHGIDLLRVAKAAWVDLLAGEVRQGGSTLTQQLMKNFFLSPARSWRRKLKEALMAYVAERRFTKDQILETYLNDIYLGQRGQEGIYGVWEASEYYFSKTPNDLTLGEMATIAGMIRSPNRLNPLRHPEAATRRRNAVLRLMREYGYISEEAYQAAVSEKLRPREVFTETNDAPYFIDFVKRELAERFPPEVLSGEGLRIFTTVDVHMQKLAERAVVENLKLLEKQHPRLKRVGEPLEAALVALEPQNGKIRAMVGGRDYRLTQFNRVTQARRQPGSVFKPVTYLAALEDTLSGRSNLFYPTSTIEDEPFTWDYGNQSWTPSNYKNEYFGQVTLEFALAESLNSATSRLAYAVGLSRVIDMARRLGFGNLPPLPSVVLGGIEVTPFEVARAYAIIANGGLQVEPIAVTAVVDRDGKIVEGHQFEARQVLSPELAYEITFMLEQVLERGTGRGVRRLGFKRPAAGKTGTTNDSNDAWFAGFTPNLLAVVWTGFDKKHGLGLTGAQAALPIWTDFMKKATASTPVEEFAQPPGIVTAVVDPQSGELATPYCPVRQTGVFPAGRAPTRPCHLHPAPGASVAPGAEHAQAAVPQPSAEHPRTTGVETARHTPLATASRIRVDGGVAP